VAAGNLVEPGSAFKGKVSAAAKAEAKASIGEAGGDQGVVAFSTDDLLPASFVEPFVENQILRILILALLTAAAISGLAKQQRERIVGAFELASQVVFRMIRIIMWAAPIGAFGGMAFTVAKRQAVGVVIPTGYSFNLDGTCIYLTLGALFIVQAAGQEISLGTQIGLLALMVLTSKGAAGIMGAGLVTLTASLQAFGGEFFSAESIAVGIALWSGSTGS
jgi:Na+/H+-dicarboxylate symporter